MKKKKREKEAKKWDGLKFSYRRLKGRIVEVFGTRSRFAEAMGISRQLVSSRLTGKTSFTQGEIWYACILLKIQKEEVGKFFYTTESEEEDSDD